MLTLEEILSRITLKDTRFKRREYSPEDWKLETLMNAVKRIGKTIDPRFVIDKDNMLVYNNICYWVMNDPRFMCFEGKSRTWMRGDTSKGIYLAGNTGTGKTTAMRILRKMYDLNFFRDQNDTRISWLEARAEEICSEYAKEGEITRFKKAPLLCIQDFGSEPNETLFMGNRLNVMRSILEYRGDHSNLVTMITSNIPIRHQDIRRLYGDRVASRLVEMCNNIELVGKDRRLER